MQESLDGWDYRTSVEFQRTVFVDGGKLFAACELPDAAEVLLVVTARCPASRFRRSVYRSKPLDRSRTECSIAFRIDGGLLSQELVLDTELILAGAIKSKSPFVATMPGSRLHQESVSVVLEGSGSRLPVEVADLASQVPGLRAPAARWYILLEDADLHAPLMGKLRVLVNSAQVGTVEQVRGADALTLSLLASDTARRVLGAALRDDEFVDDPAGYPDGSIGSCARNLLALCFPGDSARSVHTLMNADPGRFEATVQSSVRVSDD
jgi:hypothetical protein